MLTKRHRLLIRVDSETPLPSKVIFHPDFPSMAPLMIQKVCSHEWRGATTYLGLEFNSRDRTPPEFIRTALLLTVSRIDSSLCLCESALANQRRRVKHYDSSPSQSP